MLAPVLEQSNPSVTTLTDLYEVPASTKLEGKVVIANRSATGTSYRVSLASAGAADDPSHYIAYDVEIPGNDSDATPRFVAPAGCVVRVYATLATLTFTLTGLESPA